MCSCGAASSSPAARDRFRVPEKFRLEHTKRRCSRGRRDTQALRRVTVDTDTAPSPTGASRFGSRPGRRLDQGRRQPTLLPAATAESAAQRLVFPQSGQVRSAPACSRLIFADRSNAERSIGPRREPRRVHRMSPTELALLTPLRIDIVTEKQSEGVADLARTCKHRSVSSSSSDTERPSARRVQSRRGGP